MLEQLLKNFNHEALRTATGDVFGRIYEYFLMKFSMQKAYDNGEFFTPPSLVQTIVIRNRARPWDCIRSGDRFRWDVCPNQPLC